MRVYQIMVALIAALAAYTGFAAELVLPSKPTEPELLFAKTINEALEKADEKPLIAITHWKKEEGDPFWLSDFYRKTIERKVRAIRLDRVDSALLTERQEGDTRVRESLPVNWVVTIVHESEYSVITTLNAGALNGKIFFTTTYVVKKPDQQANPERQ